MTIRRSTVPRSAALLNCAEQAGDAGYCGGRYNGLTSSLGSLIGVCILAMRCETVKRKANQTEQILLRIGSIAVCIQGANAAFAASVRERYRPFLASSAEPDITLEIDLQSTLARSADEDLEVRQESGRWLLTRGDLEAVFDATTGRGVVRQTANPFSIDTVLRVICSLTLAEREGFLLHAASAVRGGRAFVFVGKSGTGKTTMMRLKPSDAIALTDEVSFVQRNGSGYVAYGTPFYGELARPGEPCKAPLEAIYFLEHSTEIQSLRLTSAEAAGGLLENMLFFAKNAELARGVFTETCRLAERVPAFRLQFTLDQRVWELIR